MVKQLLGIHHVTAIAGDPQSNLDYYTGVLGLRLVKRTVNFDDPTTYHLYYGDEVGSPGTIMTFFPWPGSPRGRRGAGQVTTTAFTVPDGSLGYWTRRLKDFGIVHQASTNPFGEEILSVEDPDGLRLELVGDPAATRRTAWERGPVPVEHAIRGFYGLTFTEKSAAATQELLGGLLGFQEIAEAGDRCRFELGGGTNSRVVIDLLIAPQAGRGEVAAGSIHHVAWRTPDNAEQLEWQNTLSGEGLNVTPVMNRQYFNSIYFREPGGVLFEIATDPPGFTWDEPAAELGSHLKLPSWLEPRRSYLERALPHLRTES